MALLIRSVSRFVALLWDRPARMVTASFLLVIFSGTGLLMLPGATSAPGGLGFLSALFTATSAVCVTGLIVVDTATAFTLAGQIIILGLIQIGALGIMAFTVSTVFLIRRRLTMDEAELLSFMLNEANRSAVVKQLGRVLGLTLLIELSGAALLFLGFLSRGFTGMEAVWLGLFHAVSAFANAGFALFSDSLQQFVDAPQITVPVMLLIVSGGIGFGVITLLGSGRSRSAGEEPPGPTLAYRPTLQGGRRRERLQRALRGQQGYIARVAVTTSLLLVVAGAGLYYLLESRHALAGMPLPRKYGAALFQSITLRTAGFDTVSFATVRRATLLIVLPFMFIGGASGGTAGGVKVGTVAILSAEIRRFFLRQHDAVLMGRRLPGRLITQATALVLSGVLIAGAALVVLVLSEPFAVEALMFEVVSALGTVGLSTGITSELSRIGRTVIILLMFVGRLGPLTLLAAFRPERREPPVYRPDGEIPVG